MQCDCPIHPAKISPNKALNLQQFCFCLAFKIPCRGDETKSPQNNK